MWFKFFGLIGINALVRRHLNDPVNWVAFIRDNELTHDKRNMWIKRLNLDYDLESFRFAELLPCETNKTFEGLASQIAKIGEDDSSSELRTRLLFNLLQVNSENPGKLISDYNKSDHPIIDAIDKSSKLADAINKLDNVPLVNDLLKHMNAKAKAQVEKKAEEAKKAFEAQTEEVNAHMKASNDATNN